MCLVYGCLYEMGKNGYEDCFCIYRKKVESHFLGRGWRQLADQDLVHRGQRID